MAIEAALTYPDLSAKAYEHPADRAATSTLHTIPLLDRVLKVLSDLGFEKRTRQLMLGDAVRLGPDQVPAVWNSYVHATSVLDLPGPRPALYVTQLPVANATTFGTKHPSVLAWSPLLTDYQPDEIEAVLAHEAGHVLSDHVYYTTVMVILAQILQGTLSAAPLAGLPVRAVYLALLEWARAAELSSDRASALAVGDPRITCSMLMRMAGGPVAEMNVDAFVRQATEYVSEDDLLARRARFSSEISRSHPFAVRRVKELVDWVASGDYDRIRSGAYVRRGEEPPPSAEFQEAVRHYRERFLAFIERTGGGVNKLSSQLADWMRTSGRGAGDQAGADGSD